MTDVLQRILEPNNPAFKETVHTADSSLTPQIQINLQTARKKNWYSRACGYTRSGCRWSILQPASFVQRSARFEGNLVWRHSYWAAEADKDLRCLFRRVSVKRTRWPLLIIFPPAEEKYVSHYEQWRLIAAVLPRRGVSDWPAVEIIAESCLSDELALAHARARRSGCPHRSSGVPSVSGALGSVSIPHRVCKCFLRTIPAILSWVKGFQK